MVATISPRPIVPESLMLECDDLPTAEDGKLATLLQNHVDVARLYHLCVQRHADLVGVLRAQESDGGH